MARNPRRQNIGPSYGATPKECHCSCGMAQKQPKVTKVLFPGLPEHPGYEINKAQTTGFGGMLSFEVDSEETAKKY